MKVLVTHNGPFHADDVLAVALFLRARTALGDRDEWVVKRTRSAEEIAEAAAAVDVGGIHDPSRLRFDHHQDKHSTTASAGMVYEHCLKTCPPYHSQDWDLWSDLVSAVDRADLGKATCDFSELVSKTNLTMSDRVGKSPEEISRMEDSRFAFVLEKLEDAISTIFPSTSPLAPRMSFSPLGLEKAMTETSRRGEMGHLESRWNSEMGQALAIFKKAVREGNASGIAVLPHAIPWQDLTTKEWMEKVDDRSYREDLAGVFYIKDTSRPDSVAWLTVPSPEDKFSPKIPFPAEWRGLRGNALVDVMNKTLTSATSPERIPHFKPEEENAVFCHGAGFFMCAPAPSPDKGEDGSTSSARVFHQVVAQSCLNHVRANRAMLANPSPTQMSHLAPRPALKKAHPHPPIDARLPS